MTTTISDIHAQEILDSRGYPTIFCEVTSLNGLKAHASVPSGASKGEHEAIELRDNNPARYQGKGVLTACDNINGPIKKILVGQNPFKQQEIDALMIEADGTDNKSHLGANSILAASLANARLAAKLAQCPLYTYLGGIFANKLPCPMMNIINGGAHADNSLEFQEFMIRPIGATTFSEALRTGVEIFHTLKSLLKKNNLSTSVGDEGGFAPNLSSHEQALELITEAILKAGYTTGKDVTIALDCAATELYDTKNQVYIEKKKMLKNEPFKKRTSQEQIAYLESLVNAYPIDSIEDGLAESDWQGFKALTAKLGSRIQIVGDDIFVTNPKFLTRGIEEHSANAILIKLNQIGTLTETINTIQLAHNNNFKTIISHRSGETEDTFIADLAVASNSGQIKTGAPSRSERVAKYNRLLQIEKELDSAALYE